MDRSGGPAGRPAGVLADRPTRRQVAEDLDEPVIEPGAPASQEVAGRELRPSGCWPRLRRITSRNLAGTMITATVIMVRAWCSVRRGPFEEAHQSGAAAARTVLRRAGDGWSESAGGTSGALWGSALTAVRAVLSDQHGADDGEIVQTVRAGAGAVVRLGDAQLGDKAMVDALIHFADTLRSSFAPGNPLAQVWLQPAGATTEAAAQTAQITAGLWARQDSRRLPCRSRRDLLPPC